MCSVPPLSRGRLRDLRHWPDPEGEDTRSLAELAAALVEHNISPDGRVTPHSAYRGFEQHSFGQKKQPSALGTARTFAVLHRLHDLAPVG